jgi:capsular polysaccharide biosynthesis protein
MGAVLMWNPNNKMRLLKNATIIPLEGTIDSFTGGVYSSDGEFIKDSLLSRGRQAPYQKPNEYLHGTYIYGGYLFGHFGHFIWESLSRLYAIKKCKENIPILYLSPHYGTVLFQESIFRRFGINNSIMVVDKPTGVDKLLYANDGSTLDPLNITDEQLNTLALIDPFTKKDKHYVQKLWLSRSKLLYGKIVNEIDIEEQLVHSGWIVIYPENVRFSEQVKLISSAEYVAGFDGSQFYTCLFAKKVLGEYIVFNRRPHIAQAIKYAFERKNISYSAHELNITHVEYCSANANFKLDNIAELFNIIDKII